MHSYSFRWIYLECLKFRAGSRVVAPGLSDLADMEQADRLANEGRPAKRQCGGKELRGDAEERIMLQLALDASLESRGLDSLSIGQAYPGHRTLFSLGGSALQTPRNSRPPAFLINRFV